MSAMLPSAKAELQVNAMKDKEWVIYGTCGLVPVVWLALLIAPCMKDGLVSAMELIPMVFVAAP